MLNISFESLNKYPVPNNWPMAVLNYFSDSAVRLKLGYYNDYYIDKSVGVPIMQIDISGVDVPVFHEMGHFLVAERKRLLKHNFGFGNKSTYYGKYWHDLNNEIQVYAIEWNLLQEYNIKSSTGDMAEYCSLLSLLNGYENYKKTKNLTNKQMKAHVFKTFKYYVNKYDIYWIESEWKARQVYLKRRRAYLT